MSIVVLSHNRLEHKFSKYSVLSLRYHFLHLLAVMLDRHNRDGF